MPRREQPLRHGEESLLAFAADLRALRVSANSPAYRELGRRVHYSAATLSEAASGRKLPSLAVTLAYVGGCGGDVAAWERRWRELAAELAEQSAEVQDDDRDPPYIGLSTFQPEHVDKFFGRGRLIEEVLTRLAERRLVAVFGPSGAGKSSLLRAGVIARWRGPSREVVLCTPGGHPLRRLDSLPEHGETLIVVDQFEEVFTHCADAAERAEFIARLVDIADDPAGERRVLLGVRADFYGHCMDSPALLAHFRDAQVAVGAMTTEELREAVVEPATRAGMRVETPLLTALVAQVSGHAGVLPLLSHALLETWRRRRGTLLTLAGFQAAGGIDGALAQTAEDLYGGFEPAQQLLVRQLFLRLTAIVDGVGDVKARVGRDELAGDPDVSFVLERLAAARLVLLDKDSVEMTHEALLRSWPRLRDWLAEDRDGRRVHQQLTEAANGWAALDHDPGALYRGIRLETAREWRSRTETPLTAREHQFLDASLAARDQEQTRERRQRVQLRQLVALLSMLLVVAIAGGYAFYAEGNASRERNIAMSQRVAIEAAGLRAANPALASELALAAYRMSPTPEARGSLLSTVGAPYATQVLGHSSIVSAVAFSPDGTLMATASTDSTIKLSDVRDPHHPKEITTLVGHTAGVTAVAFGRGVLASVSWDDTVRLWDIRDPRRTGVPIVLGGHRQSVHAVAISADGRTMATGSADHTVRLWDLTDPRHPAPLTELAAHGDAVLAVAFRGQHGELLATGSADRTIRLWDTTDPRNPVAVGTATGSTDRIGTLAFSPDGHTLASGGDDKMLRLWDVTDPGHPTQTASVVAHTGAVRAIAFAPDGSSLASVSVDRTVRLWVVNNAGLSELATFTGHTGGVYGVAFSPDGMSMATTSDDHTTRLWDMSGPILGGHSNAVYDVAFSPDGKVVATAGYDGTILVRGITDPMRPDEPTVLAQHTGPVNAVVFAPDGRTLASASADHTVRFWDVHDLRHITEVGEPITVYHDAVNSVAYSHDGKLLATGGSDRVVKIWDLSDPWTPREIASMPIPAGIDRVAFSPDRHRLAAAGDDGRTRLWDVTDPTHPLAPVVLGGHNGDVKSVAFSPDGTLLATASADRTVRLWDLDHLGDALPPIAHTDVVYSVTFSGDGKTLATASADSLVRLWDISDRAHPTEQADLDAHTDRVYAVAVSPDGHTLASAGQDHTTRLWDIDPDRVAARVCAAADPPLSRADWDRYFPGMDYNPPC